MRVYQHKCCHAHTHTLRTHSARKYLYIQRDNSNTNICNSIAFTPNIYTIHPSSNRIRANEYLNPCIYCMYCQYIFRFDHIPNIKHWPSEKCAVWMLSSMKIVWFIQSFIHSVDRTFYNSRKTVSNMNVIGIFNTFALELKCCCNSPSIRAEWERLWPNGVPPIKSIEK